MGIKMRVAQKLTRLPLSNKSTVLFVFLFAVSALPLFSQERTQDRLVDRAGLLNSGRKDSLISRLNSLSEAYNFDLVIVTEKTIDGARPMDYADDFFDNNGYGLGSDRDGCLFLIITGTRDYWFSTSGRGIGILNSSAFDKLASDAVKSLREDNYYAAFNSYLENWEQFLILESRGSSYNADAANAQDNGTDLNFFEQWNMVLVLAGWLIALAIGFGVVHIWKKGMNTALPQTQADSYVIPGSLVFDVKTDRFLYSVVTKTARPKDPPAGYSQGGLHTGSSGRSHGGGGGRY